RLLLGGAADLANHHDTLGLGIGVELFQHVDEGHAVDRVAADADTGALAQTDVGGLLDRLVGQGAGAGDDADRTGHVDVARHDADLALARRDDARAVGADQVDVREILQGRLDLQHVQHRNAFGDAGDYLDAALGRFQDRVGGEGCRHVDHARRGAGGFHRVAHGVEYRQVEMLLAAAARSDAADQLGAVGQRLLGVEGALLTGKALADHLGVLVDQNAHVESSLGAYLLTAATTFLAASVRLSAGIRLRPLWASSSLPFSTLVPSRRTTTGTLTPTSFTAAMMPSAIMSQRTMPPKMLTRMPSTLGLERISLKASVTRSLVAPPPTSRKLAGSPPCSLITSMVAIARPAPLTMQPMLPSRVM